MSYTHLLQRIQKGLSTVELVHTSHPRWPLPAHSSALPQTLHISVLDASFNPPTLAHLALANTLPPQMSPGYPPDFDARLLLLSVRNADKQLKPTDATYEQRIEMLVLLAHDLARSSARSVPAAQAHLPDAAATPHEANVAVALIDEPTFVGKSALLRTALSARLAALLAPDLPARAGPPAPSLTFLMGTDTVVRLFAPRYYPSERAMHAALRRFLGPDTTAGADGSRIVCARRVTRGVPRAEEERAEREMAARARELVPGAQLAFVDIGERECTFSSSEVRELVAKGDVRWKEMVTPSVAEYVVTNNLYVASS
ncbi:hypothetical protein BD413DRAFT_480138 [Trametes elegans]|nr:hypothetical protein BD413DRAFT_480138 [Trametes elegans]